MNIWNGVWSLAGCLAKCGACKHSVVKACETTQKIIAAGLVYVVYCGGMLLHKGVSIIIKTIKLKLWWK